ncbi:putative DEAD/DEAH box helicase-like, partial [Homarus americanus]
LPAPAAEMTRGVRVCVIAVVAVLTLAALPVSPLKVTDSNQSHMELRGNRSIVKDPEMNDKSDIMSHSLYLGDLAMQNRGKPSKNKGKPSKNKGKPSKNKGKPSKNKGKPSKNKGKPSKNKGKHAMRGRSCKKCKKNPRKNVELSPWESVCISVRRGKGAFPEKWTLKVKPPAWSPWHLNITCPRIYGKYRKGQGPPVFSITEGEKSSWQVHDSKVLFFQPFTWKDHPDSIITHSNVLKLTFANKIWWTRSKKFCCIISVTKGWAHDNQRNNHHLHHQLYHTNKNTSNHSSHHNTNHNGNDYSHH